MSITGAERRVIEGEIKRGGGGGKEVKREREGGRNERQKEESGF